MNRPEFTGGLFFKDLGDDTDGLEWFKVAQLGLGRSRAVSELVVPTSTGTVYVALVIDVFARRIVGWRVSSLMIAQFVLDALE